MKQTTKTYRNKYIYTMYIICTFMITSVVGNNVSALTYSDNVGLNFTFDTSLSVSLSSPDIVINGLIPGTSADSNELTITVLSNNSTGYVLNSSVGSSTSPYSTYGRNLINGNIGTSGSNNTLFSSIDYSSIPTATELTTPSTWGYSYTTPASNDGNGNITWSSWSNYNGLPLYSDTTNIATLNSNSGPSLSTGDKLKFKIAAYADNQQLAGEYTNLINFTIVANATPTSFYDAFSSAGKTMYNGYYKMQDMNTGICNNVYTSQLVDNTDTMEAQLIDIRDHNVYWVAKLKDGHCWMTQNLDLNLDKDVALTSEDTDLTDHSLTGAYVDGYAYDAGTGITTWRPMNSTIDAVTDENTSKTIVGYQNSPSIPHSVDVGAWYWSGAQYNSNLCNVNSNYQTCNYIAKNNSTYSIYFSTAPYDNNGTHGHVGNYYNWSSSIASNNSESIASSTIESVVGNPQNSVCPADWRLPTIYGGSTTDDARNEYFILNKLYNFGSGSYDLEKGPLFFVRGGGVDGAMLVYAGFYNYYWSSTVSSWEYAYRLYADSNMSQPADGKYGGRGFGLSVRCLAR